MAMVFARVVIVLLSFVINEAIPVVNRVILVHVFHLPLVIPFSLGLVIGFNFNNVHVLDDLLHYTKLIKRRLVANLNVVLNGDYQILIVR